MKHLLLTVVLILNLFSSSVYANAGWLNEFDLNQYKNKVVYLDFWASWCGPCRKLFPWLNKMQEKYKDDGLVVIGINLDRDKKMADRFLTKLPANFLLYSDPTGELGEKYKLQGMPSSFIFDGTGQLSITHVLNLR
ncbi:TlpA disulfide reductase family protein [Psychromonas hadalis]|uniref:TlpA disulfide reductase family protein n=1 Tax=Psychromonas hadalis TaxID=211669 RepID=UPI0003B6417C|nr:TlpA disulfide reductase family protein [Psychromonas hadalis]